MAKREILDSWKEISDYLKRDARTCQRYERDLGLPIHRLDGSPKARVFAYRDELDAWLIRKSEERVQRRRLFRTCVLAALFVTLVAFTLLLIWKLLPQKDDFPVFPPDRPSIAILNLANRTGEESLGRFRDVLAGMISEDLSQSRYIYVVPADQVTSVISRLGLRGTEAYTRQDLKGIGRRAVAEFVATGHYSKAGERYLISLTVREADSGRTLGTVEAQGVGIECLFDLVDELTVKIKPLLELTAVEIANDIDGRLDQVSTSSLEAYCLYVRAAKLGYSLKWQEAIDILKKAVALDSEFAMAYRRIATFYMNLGASAEYRKNIDKALDLSNRLDRLTLREKLLIQGQAPTERKLALEAWTRLLEIYPEDYVGNNSLGVLYDMVLDQPDKAVDLYAVLLRNRADNVVPHNNLAHALCRLGKLDEAKSVAKNFIREFHGQPGAAPALRSLAHAYMLEGKYGRAQRALQKAVRLGPHLAKDVSRSKAKALLLEGDFDRAEAELRRLVTDTDAAFLQAVHQELAWIYKARGEFMKADESYRRAFFLAEEAGLVSRKWELTWDRVENHLAGGRRDQAETVLADFRARLEAQGRSPGDNAYYLLGQTTLLTKKAACEEARPYAAAFVSLAERSANKRAICQPLRALGVIAMEQGEVSEAIDLLCRAKSLLWFERTLGDTSQQPRELHAFFMEPLALAYFSSGDLERARQEYEAITKLTTGRLAYGDIYARSFYMLGRIYEQLGKRRPARANYRKFLELWKNADAGLPEVEDTRKRLAGLKGS